MSLSEASIIAIAMAQFALWMRFEHRMTVLETMFKERQRQATSVVLGPVPAGATMTDGC